jgi:hypothetical protein
MAKVRRQQYQKYNIFWTQKLCKMAYNDIPTQNGAVQQFIKNSISMQNLEEIFYVLFNVDEENISRAVEVCNAFPILETFPEQKFTHSMFKYLN